MSSGTRITGAAGVVAVAGAVVVGATGGIITGIGAGCVVDCTGTGVAGTGAFGRGAGRARGAGAVRTKNAANGLVAGGGRNTGFRTGEGPVGQEGGREVRAWLVCAEVTKT